MERVVFRGKKYPLRSLFLDTLSEEVIISTTDLNDVILNKCGAYISKKARLLDEIIFFFVEKNEIELSINDLNRIIKEAI